MQIIYRLREPMSNEVLVHLMDEAWDDSRTNHWDAVLARSLTWVTAHDGEKLIGFVNLAWDGGLHGFLLDTTVHPTVRRRGIGSELVRRALEEAQTAGLEWLHVDHEPDLTTFYRRCGFQATDAGLIHLGKSN
jgi:ribosomal protein S18 acetylase RimI-like enzyme